MFMPNVHVISDLNFGWHEVTPDEETLIPKSVDLVILNGNLGAPKRSMMYALQLCKLYPKIQFVYNDGELERYWNVTPKNTPWEYENAMNIRKAASSDWPKNLHWRDPRSDEGLLITLQTGHTVNVFTTFGFPKIVSYKGDWKDTYWYKNFCLVAEYVHKMDNWKNFDPIELEIVKHGTVPLWFTQEHINSVFSETEAKLKKWETSLKNTGILVTHINPYNDPRCENCIVAPYQIHTDNILWITSKTYVDNIKFLGGKLYSNPGRGSELRSNIVRVN